jgi:hypothetical protein
VKLPSECGNFTHKGYGRIYVLNEAHVKELEALIEELDSFEFIHYYPQGLVASASVYPNVIYVGKFCLPLEFKEECKKRNIPICIFDSGDEMHPNGMYKMLTKDNINQMLLEDLLND